MNNRFILWFTVVGTIGVLFGILYAFFGLAVLPAPNFDSVPWGNGVYGATLIGFSVTILFVGRHAFQKNDAGLMKALLYGIFAWLIVEALFSIYYKVYSNVAVDATLMLITGFPLIRGIRSLNKGKL